MSNFVDFSGNSKALRKSNSGNVDFLWLKRNNKYRIRPIGKPVEFFKYFRKDADNKARTAITADPDNCPVYAAHEQELNKASLRYAMYCIDRSDGKIKIVEGPKTAFYIPLCERANLTEKDPTGVKTGGDWVIDVVTENKMTKYKTQFIEDTPLTKEEIEILKEFYNEHNAKEKLANIYKTNTPEEIEKRLFGDIDDNDDSNETVSSSQSESVDESIDESGSEDSEDDMNWL